MESCRRAISIHKDYYEKEELSQYKPIQKFIDRLVFKKLKYTIKTFCSSMTPELLLAISPRLYDLVYKSSKIIQIKFKLLGSKWPPQIVYSSNVARQKVIGFKYQELDPKPSWRFLFTDNLINPIKPRTSSLQKLSKPSRRSSIKKSIY